MPYHLAVGSGDARYLRIGGTPSAPTIEADVVITAGDVQNAMYRIFSPDGGVTLFATGLKWESSPALGHSMDRSVDGGSNWSSLAAQLPGGAADQGHAVFGWQGNPRVICTTSKSFGPDRICRLNAGLTAFEMKQSLPDSARAYGLFAVEGTDIAYAMLGTSASDGLWRTLDGGETWARDATFDATSTVSHYHIVVDPDGETITTIGFASTAIRAMRGKWGGPWTETALPGGSLGSGIQSTRLTVTEDGAVWAYSDQGAIYRRDPGTGTWALSGTHSNGNGVGGIWAVSSTDVLAVRGGYLYWWDGDTWTEVDYLDLGISTWVAGGVWAAVDPNPPVITPLDPVDGQQGVDKAAPISLSLVDTGTGINLSTFDLYVRDTLVVEGGSLIPEGWSLEYFEIESGYRAVLTPERQSYHRWDIANTVVARVEDVLGNSDAAEWTFYVGRPFKETIYPMVFSGVRSLDETE